MIPADVLRAIRNDLPMPVTIKKLARDGPYGKMSEGFFRFVCPHYPLFPVSLLFFQNS